MPFFVKQLLSFSFFYSQTNVSINASCAVWIGQRPELLCIAGDGSSCWLSFQVFWITVGACRRCRATKPAEHLHPPWQPCTRLTLASAAHQLQQNQAHQQHFGQQWTCKYHRQIIRLSLLFYALECSTMSTWRHIMVWKKLIALECPFNDHFLFLRLFWPACTNTSPAFTLFVLRIHHKSHGRHKNHLHSTRRSLSLSQLIR